jgi:hypothetical protein
METSMSRIHLIALTGLTIVGFRLIPETMLTTGIPGARAADVPHAHKIEMIAGTTDKRIILTPKAAQRLDVQTGAISLGPTGDKIAPYGAVFFDLAGASWVYTNPEPLAFVKRKVSIAKVQGDMAHLTDGPSEGTTVVTVGVAELYGAERGVGH